MFTPLSLLGWRWSIFVENCEEVRLKMMQNSGKKRKIDFFCKIADFSAFFAIQTRFFVVKSYHKNFGGTEGSTHMLKKGCVIKVMNEQSMNRSLKNRHLQMISLGGIIGSCYF